jgi:hypothetical protein
VLAPVLARLDSIPGVEAARVDSSGRFFWVEIDESADASRVTDLAEGVLGQGARALPPAGAEAQLAERRLGDPWLGAGEVMTLSFVESRLLSVRLAGELERRTGASPEQRELIAEAIRRELFAAMERVHAEGGRSSSGWIYREWPAIAEAAVERCAGALPEEPRLRFAELLPALLTR